MYFLSTLILNFPLSVSLTSTQKIKETDRGKFKINVDRKYNIGKLDITSNGNGYFICEDFEDDIFIPSINLNKGLHQDTVKVFTYSKRGSKKLEADVVEVLERAKTEFVYNCMIFLNLHSIF